MACVCVSLCVWKRQGGRDMGVGGECTSNPVHFQVMPDIWSHSTKKQKMLNIYLIAMQTFFVGNLLKSKEVWTQFFKRKASPYHPTMCHSIIHATVNAYDLCTTYTLFFFKHTLSNSHITFNAFTTDVMAEPPHWSKYCFLVCMFLLIDADVDSWNSWKCRMYAQ